MSYKEMRQIREMNTNRPGKADNNVFFAILKYDAWNDEEYNLVKIRNASNWNFSNLLILKVFKYCYTIQERKTFKSSLSS